jgi:hypothetical protein
MELVSNRDTSHRSSDVPRLARSREEKADQASETEPSDRAVLTRFLPARFA